MENVYIVLGLGSEDRVLSLINHIAMACGDTSMFNANGVSTSSLAKAIYQLSLPFEQVRLKNLGCVKERFMAYGIDIDIDVLLSKLVTLHEKLMAGKYVAAGYKYLTKDLHEKAKIALETKGEVIDTLLEEVTKFDFTYPMSDVASTYKHGVEREEELTKRIDASDYSPSQKALLKKALCVGPDILASEFPQTRLSFIGPVDQTIIDLIHTDNYDEGRLERILTTLQPLSSVMCNQSNLRGLYTIGLQRSKEVDTYSLRYSKLALSDKDQDCLNNILDNVTVDDLTYLKTVHEGLSSYVNEGTPGAPNYVYYNPIVYPSRLLVENTEDGKTQLVFCVTNIVRLYTCI